MEAIEVDKLIGELEVGVDRLRSLYEQYFMGFEKLEPTVVRKDVDRKIHALRKEQIRNTALRFRFQMVLQRYNTYQTHWQRICREIENGTYKRHLSRAQRRFASESPSADAGRIPPPSSLPPIASPSSIPPARPLRPGAPLPADLAAELAELDKEFAPAPAGAPRGGPRAAAARPLNLPPAGHDPLRPGVSGVKPPPPLNLPPAGHDPLRPGVSGVKPPPPTASVPKAKGAPAPAQAQPPRQPPQPGNRQPPRPTPSAAPAAQRPPAPGDRSGPAPVAARAAPPPDPASPSLASRRMEDLPDDRLRQIYSQYVEARRRQKDATAELPFEALAKNLRESEARLRHKHGKAVDFEVMVKDGKTFLRPVIK